MARVTHVKKAQQRYETTTVRGDDGQPVKIALTRADGSPKMTRAKGSRPARPVFITKTVADKSKPKPLLSCDFPGCTIDGGKIAIGTPYKWVKPKSGPYGGRQRQRHEAHPSWMPWDLSSSISAQAQRIAHEAQTALESVESDDDVTAVLEDASSQIRDDLAEQRRESASNMEEGFGHETYQSEQLNSDADELEGWADEVESADFTTLEDFLNNQPAETCDECNGTGEVENPDYDADEAAENEDYTEDENVECDECNGSGEQEVDPENPSDDDLSEWRQQVQEELSVLDECPL